ncbi:MAG: DUF3305 domain-containing protein [Rhizobiaceae bacterium]
MSAAPPLASIPVGVLVERSKGLTQWTDYLWRPTEVLTGEPETPEWTKLSGDDDRAVFFAGRAAIELYRTETPNYRENLESGTPQLWVGLRPSDGEPPYELIGVTADPAEGEAMTEAGENVVEPIPMPDTVYDAVAAFVSEHNFERKFVKRKRDRANPDSLGRRAPVKGDRA